MGKTNLRAADKLVGAALGTPYSFKRAVELAPNEIGVYVFSMNGEVKYVGRAIENRPGQSTRGLRKRLQEHWRGADNCKYEVYKNRNSLDVKLCVCSSVEQAKSFEVRLIRQYDTVRNGWNDRYELPVIL